MSTAIKRFTYKVDPNDHVEIWFEGTKTFWKEHITLDILLVAHTKLNVIEIISYSPESSVESNRIYVNSLIVSGNIDQSALQQRIADKKELLLRRKQNINITQITTDLLKTLTCQYLLSRLSILTPNENSSNVSNSNLKVLQLFLTSLSEDHIKSSDADRIMGILPSAPTNLIPFKLQGQKKFSSQEIQMTLSALKKDKLELQKATRLAELAVATIEAFKNHHPDVPVNDKDINAAHTHWKKALHRVLLQIESKKMRDKLISMGMYTAFEDVDAGPSTATSATTFTKQPTKVTRRASRRSLDCTLLLENSSSKSMKFGLSRNSSMVGNALSISESASVLPPLSDPKIEGRRRRSRHVSTLEAMLEPGPSNVMITTGSL